MPCARRDHFQNDVDERQEFICRTGLPLEAEPSGKDEERLLSLFCYDQDATREHFFALFDAIATGDTRWRILTPPGEPRRLVDAYLGSRGYGEKLRTHHHNLHGNVLFTGIPFLSPDDYDRLLWPSDVNLVRGEDSFVRAQWAARPFIWHIYPQEETAHHVKLQAFVERSRLPDTAALLWLACNGSIAADIVSLWRDFSAALPKLSEHARIWCEQLATPPESDLAHRLLHFAEKNCHERSC